MNQLLAHVIRPVTSVLGVAQLIAAGVVGGCMNSEPPSSDGGPAPGAVVVVRKGGDGNGLTKSTPEGIDCDTACEEQRLSLAADVTSLTLQATPARDALFAEWRCETSKNGLAGNPIVVTTPEVEAFADEEPAGVEVQCTATFRQLYTLQVFFSGSGSGHIVGSAAAATGGTRIDCGTKCTAGYFAGEEEELTATADVGSVFTGWKLDCSGTGPAPLQLDENKDCEAHFCPTDEPTCP